jgi:hypothetical protein
MKTSLDWINNNNNNNKKNSTLITNNSVVGNCAAIRLKYIYNDGYIANIEEWLRDIYMDVIDGIISFMLRKKHLDEVAKAL